MTRETINFFFIAARHYPPPDPEDGPEDPASPRPRDTPARFPLYTEAVRFFKHPDSMVRTTARTITLNVFHGEGWRAPEGD